MGAGTKLREIRCSIMKIFAISIAIIILHLSRCQCQSGFYCLRDQEDFFAEGWDDFLQSSIYAATAADLPPIFRGKIEGEGIFYFDGAIGFGDQSIANYPPDLEEPVYLYVKYYAHNVSGSNAEPYVLPAKYPDNGYNYYLKLEDDFLWKEEVVEISKDDALMAGIASGFYSASAGDYYLIDTMVIAYGGNISPDEVVGLCPPKILPTTTPAVTESTTDLTTDSTPLPATSPEAICSTTEPRTDSTPTTDAPPKCSTISKTTNESSTVIATTTDSYTITTTKTESSTIVTTTIEICSIYNASVMEPNSV